MLTSHPLHIVQDLQQSRQSAGSDLQAAQAAAAERLQAAQQQADSLRGDLSSLTSSAAEAAQKAQQSLTSQQVGGLPWPAAVCQAAALVMSPNRGLTDNCTCGLSKLLPSCIECNCRWTMSYLSQQLTGAKAELLAELCLAGLLIYKQASPC